MKIAVSADGPGVESAVDTRFGRCPCFVIYDTETLKVETQPNEQNLNTPQGAGIQSAGLICNAGCNAVITGHCGPKAFSALSAGGVEVYRAQGISVSEAIEAFVAGRLDRMAGADVEGHW